MSEMEAQQIGKSVASALARLERDGCPEDAICHHLGVQAAPVAGLTIGLSPWGESSEHTLVTIYHQNQAVGYPASIHDDRARAVAAATDSQIVETWNGNDGVCGISVVISRPCPKALSRSIANYRMLPNVFKTTPDETRRFQEFDAWFGEIAVA